jgi:hypothetical protein
MDVLDDHGDLGWLTIGGYAACTFLDINAILQDVIEKASFM